MGRKAALLTTTQRGFLEGETVDNPTRLKSRMRQRLRDGVQDFTDLFERLPPDLRQEVFKGLTAPTPAEEEHQTFTGGRDAADGDVDFGMRTGFIDPESDWLSRTNSDLERGMVDAVAFFYIAAKDAGLDPTDLIEYGVRRAEDELNDGAWQINSVTLEVDKDVKHTLAKNALRNISQGKDLTDAEVRALLETGRGNITPEQIRDYLNGVWRPDESVMLDPASGV